MTSEVRPSLDAGRTNCQFPPQSGKQITDRSQTEKLATIKTAAEINPVL
jgi:hypothetical protein